jgi:C1A family cysteine protease
MDKEEKKVELEEQEKELQEEIEKFKKLEEETDEMIEEDKSFESEEEKELDDEENSEEDSEEEREESEEEEEKEPEEKEDDSLENSEEKDEEVSEEEKPEKVKEDTEEQESTDKMDNFRKIFIIALVIIILLLIFLIVFKKYNKDQKSKNDKVTIEDLSENNREIMNVDSNKTESKQEEIKKEIIDKNTSENKKEYDKLDEKEKEKVEVVPSENDVPIQKLDNMDDLYDETTNLPKKYNLKDSLKLKLEDQGSYGLCWSFATNNSIETNYMLKTKKDLDLSEIYDDYMLSDTMFSYRTVHDGGNFSDISLLSDMFGLAKEEKDEYKDYSFEESFDFLSRNRSIYLVDSVRFPSIYKTNGKVNEVTDEELSKEREMIKKHIMEYGSIYAVISASAEKNVYVSGGDGSYANHAISVVGWDDTYSKDNFKAEDGSKPIHDGAYII